MVESISAYQKVFGEIEDYAILLLDKNGNITDWNKGVEKIKGYRQDEIIGRNFRIFYTPADIAKRLPEQLMKKAITEGKASNEGWRVRKDGTQFWGSILLTAIYDGSGLIEGFSKITRDLTERKEAEEKLMAFNRELELKVAERTAALQVSENRYKYIFSNNPLPMWVLALKDFRFLDVNYVATLYYGYSRDEFLSMTAYDIRPEEEKILFSIAEHPETIRLEDFNREIWKHQKKDGTIIDVEVFGHNIVYEGENARLILINDITERRIAERKLVSRVQRFRAILENNYDAISLNDEAGNIIYQSPAVERMLGYSIDEMRGANALEFFHPDDLPEVVRLMEVIVSSPGKVIWAQNRKRHKDGHYIWTEGTATNLLHDKNVAAVVINFRDITERKLAEEKLTASEHQFRALIENSTDMLMLYDKDRRLTYCSPSVEKNVGLSLAALKGTKMEDTIFVDDIDKINNLLDLVFLFPQIPLPIVVRQQYQDGNHIWVEGTLNNLLDDPYVNAIVCNYRNITERKAAEQQLEESYREIQKLQHHTDEAFTMLDKELNIVSFNRNSKNHSLRYYSRPIEKGMFIFDIIRPSRIEILKEVFADVLNGETREVMTEYTGADGDVVYISNLVKPVKNIYGDIEGVFIINRDVTGKVIAQRKIEFDHSNLTALINNTNDLMWSLDRERRLITSNAAFDERVKNFSGNIVEKGGDILPAGFGEDNISRWSAFYDRAFGGEVFTEVIRSDTPGERWSEVSFYPIFKGEEIIGTACYSRDITQRLEAKANLKFSEETRRLIINGAIDAIMCIDSQGVITTWNPQAERTFGWREAEILGKRISDTVIPMQNRHLHENGMKAYFSSSQGVGLNRLSENIGMRKDGSIVPIEITVVPIMQNGEEYYCAFIRDITMRKQTENLLRASENKYRAMIESSADSISLLSRDGEIIYQSPTGARISGFSHEELKGQNGFSLLHPDDVGEARGVFMQALEMPGVPLQVTYRIRHKTKGWVYSDTTVTNLLHDEDVKAVIINGKDVTERKQAEQKIINANRLYLFISQINQVIVHSTDAVTVFSEACRIAIECGKFTMAWIGEINIEKKAVTLIEKCGMPNGDLMYFSNVSVGDRSRIQQVIDTCSYSACNDIENEPNDEFWLQYAARRGLRSNILLPIKQAGKVWGIFSLYASEVNLFDTEEVKLLMEVAGDISFALDVFEKDKLRRLAEQKLVTNEFRFNEAQEIASLGNWEIDLVSGVHTWSKEAAKIIGLPDEEITLFFNSYIDAVHPEDRGWVLKVIDDASEGFHNSFFHHRILRRNGEVRHVYCESKYEFDGAGNPVRLHGIVHDITGSKETEDALASSDANLRLIMDMIPQAIFALDEQGKYLFVNKSFAGLYGLSPSAFIAESIVNGHSEKKFDFPDLSSYTLAASGGAYTIPELVLTDSNGTLHVFYTTIVPYQLPDDTAKAFLGIALDITERKRAESERAGMMLDIVQRNKDLEQFSYIISHNLRAPVANIIGLTELINGMALSMDEKMEMIGDLSDSVNKLDDVIKDLNLILQVKSQVAGKKEIVSFAEITEGIKNALADAIKRENAEIIYDFSQADKFETLRTYIYNVFFNLVSNSIKYRRPEIRPVIEITSRQAENKIVLVFKDNGLGIDLNRKKDLIFGLYKRFHKHMQGKGIGLYMVKTQVEALGGTIAVTSEVEKGTEFTIEFEVSP